MLTKTQVLQKLKERYQFDLSPFRFQYFQKRGLIDAPRIVSKGKPGGMRGYWADDAVERVGIICWLSEYGYKTNQIKWALENVDRQFAQPGGPHELALIAFIATMPKEEEKKIEWWKHWIALHLCTAREALKKGYPINPNQKFKVQPKIHIASEGGGYIQVKILGIAT